MFQRLIVTFIDREPGPFADRLQQIGLVDRVLDVDSWWTLNGTVIVTVHEDNEDTIDDLSDLPFVKSVHYDTIVTQDAIEWEDVNIAPDWRTQYTAGLVKYISYFTEGIRDRINVPWTSNGFDYAVPVETTRKGAGIYACVMDGGIPPTNSEFTDRTIIALPRRGLDSIGFHGSACAQHIGGNTLGFAPECTFIDANCFGDSSSTATSNIVASMGDLSDHVAANLTNGEMVVCNMSFGSTVNEFDSPLDEMQSLGIVCFAASGNGNQTTVGNAYPADLLEYGTVGALDYSMNRAWFSNWGPKVYCHQFGRYVPMIGTTADAADNDSVTLISGTSFACPFTVGCFVTWAAGKKAPSGKAGCEFMQKQFIRTQGLYDYVKDKAGELDLTQAAFIQPDNSTISSSLVTDSGSPEVIVTYGESVNGIGTRQSEVALLHNEPAGGIGTQSNELLLTYGGTMTDFIISNNPISFGGVKNLTAGRFPADYASNSIYFAYGQTCKIPFPQSENEIWCSFYLFTWDQNATTIFQPAIYLNHLGATPAPTIGMFTLGDNYRAFKKTTSGGPSTGQGNYVLEAGSLMTPQTLYRFDIFIKFEETDTLNSTFQMYIDGVLVYDKSNFVRFASASVGYERALYIGDSVVTTIAAFWGTYLSNIRVSSTDTRGKDFLSLPLDTVGTYNEFDLDGFAALADGTGKLMARSQTAAQRVSGTLDYPSIPDNGAISEVKISSVFSVDSAAANPNALAHFIRVGTTNYDQALAEPVNFRDVLLTSLATNPNTAVAWALADLNGMQFGLLSGNIA